MNINEHLWSGIIHRSESGKERKEIINYIGKTKEGEKLFLSTANAEEGTILELDDKTCFQIEELEDCYFCVVRTEQQDIYYRYEPDEDARLDDESNMVTWLFNVLFKNLTKNNFVWLRAFISAMDFDDASYMDGTMVYGYNDVHSIRIEKSYGGSFYGFDSEDAAEKFAIETEEEDLKNFITESKYNKYLDKYGYDFFDIDRIKSYLHSYYIDRFCNVLSDYEKINELLDNKIISKTGDYFKKDDNGKIDITQPRVDIDSYSLKYAECKMQDLYTNQDYVEKYSRIVDGFCEMKEEVIDFKELARLIVNDKGIAKIIANEDPGIEKEVTAVKDGVKYYFYRSDI